MATDPSVVSAQAMIAAGRPHQAIPVLLARLRRSANDAQALALLGMASSMTGNHTDAQLFADRAAKLAPSDAWIVATRASISGATTGLAPAAGWALPAGSPPVGGPVAPVPAAAPTEAAADSVPAMDPPLHDPEPVPAPAEPAPGAAWPESTPAPSPYLPILVGPFARDAGPPLPQTSALLRLREAAASHAGTGGASSVPLTEASLMPQGSPTPRHGNEDILEELSAIRTDTDTGHRKRDLWRLSAAGAVSAVVAVAFLLFRLTSRAVRSSDDDNVLPLILVVIIAVACIGAVVVATRWYLGLRLAPAEAGEAIAHERRRRRSRLAAVLLVAVLALVVAGATVAAELTQSRLTPIADLTAGACYTKPAGENTPRLRVVPCTDPHDGEIIGTVPLTSLGAAFPGDDALQRYAVTACQTPFRLYVGRPYRGAGDTLWLNTFVPHKEYWDQGMRTGWCVAQEPRGLKMTTSVRGGSAER